MMTNYNEKFFDESQLKERVTYIPETGQFYRDDRKLFLNVHKGGHLYISFLDHKFAAHRLAWFLYYGEWPDGYVLHKDGNKKNNKIDNLELKQRKWMIRVIVSEAGVKTDLGLYETREEAVRAREEFMIEQREQRLERRARL